MGIDFQSAPAGHQRVGGPRGQASKATDASQSDNPLGFAELMSLMSSQQPESLVADESSLIASEENTPLISGELLGGAVFALPSPPRSTTASQLQADGTSASSIGNLALAVDLMLPQASIQVAGLGAVSPGMPPEAPLQPGLAPLGAGAVGIPITDGLAQVTITEGAGLAQPADDLRSMVDGQLPAMATGHGEPTLTLATRPATDQSKGLDAKLVVTNAEPGDQVLAQMSGQLGLAGVTEPPAPAAVLKPGGSWALQQTALTGQARQDSNELAANASGVAGFGSSPLVASIMLLNPQDAGIRLAERPAKHLSNRYGAASEGVYGQPMTAANLAENLFQVTPTSAAAASTVVAETVSYWASQGVQNASLQLDGFGDEPVEVRISVTGDLAQVDFRTDQPEVRLAIEGAASQLKDMLSSQGMQLAGLSIGMSGRGGAHDKGSRQSSDDRKVMLIKPEAVETVRARGANPSVGQSLDLFV